MLHDDRLEPVRELAGPRPSVSFDLITRLAAMSLNVPLVSIVAGAQTGSAICTWTADEVLAGQLALAQRPLCQQVIDSGQQLIIDDASQESPRRIRYRAELPEGISWAGFPVRGQDRSVVAVLCAAHRSARHWAAREIAILQVLAEVASGAAVIAPGNGMDAHAWQAAGSPGGATAAPAIDGLQVAARSMSATTRIQSPGGCWDMFPLPGGQVAVTLCDALSMEPSAACRAALARFALGAAARAQSRPDKVLTGLDEASRARPQPDQPPMTAILATFRPVRAGLALRVSSSGPAQALVGRPDGSVRALGRPGRLPGLYPSPELHDERALLRSGASLLLVTGGVLASRAKADGEPFGSGRLRDVIADLGDAQATRIAGGVLDAVRDFTGGELDCDAVALAVKVSAARSPLRQALR